jgi:ribosome biogenesis SPOUT family RNA methylase Rps3
MTTDTAVAVSQIIMEGKRLDEISFTDRPDIVLNKHESINMPFRYLKDHLGKPIMADGMLQHIVEEETIF